MKASIIYLLDRSGSMHSIWKDAFDGLNAYIEEQKKVPGDCDFQLHTFSTHFDELRAPQDIHNVPAISHTEVAPGGGTALLDALGRVITEAGERFNAAEVKPDKVICVVMTDGEENSSRNYLKEQICQLIKQQEDEWGWEFLFVGADQDAFATSAAMGMKAINTVDWDKTPEGTRKMYGAVGSLSTSYRQ